MSERPSKGPGNEALPGRRDVCPQEVSPVQKCPTWAFHMQQQFLFAMDSPKLLQPIPISGSGNRGENVGLLRVVSALRHTSVLCL